MFEISELDYSVLSYQNNYRISLEIVYKHTSAENIFGIAKLIVLIYMLSQYFGGFSILLSTLK